MKIPDEFANLSPEKIFEMLSKSTTDSLNSASFALSPELKEGLAVVRTMFVEHNLPVEALRDPQVAIAVMQFRTTGLEILRRLVEAIHNHVSANAEIAVIDAKARHREVEGKVTVAINESLPDGEVKIAGTTISVVDLVSRLNKDVPVPILQAFLSGNLGMMGAAGLPGSSGGSKPSGSSMDSLLPIEPEGYESEDLADMLGELDDDDDDYDDDEDSDDEY